MTPGLAGTLGAKPTGEGVSHRSRSHRVDSSVHLLLAPVSVDISVNRSSEMKEEPV